MEDIEKLEGLFRSFATFGNRRSYENCEYEIDGTRLGKLARDCKVLDRNLNRNQIDIIFNKIKSPGKRKIDFNRFFTCTEQWARCKGISHSALVTQMIQKDYKPTVNGTVPQPVAFHDDKSKYTGTHKNGGPESATKANGKRSYRDLSTILDRSPSNIRGVPIVVDQETDVKKPEKHFNMKNKFKPMECKDQKEEFTWKINVEGKDYMIHPDWEKRVNIKHVGMHDKYYYVNKITNERTWSIPTVPTQPPQN